MLTAAHVVDNAKTLSFTIGGQTYQVDRKIVYPGWNGNLWSGYDIGLVHLAKAVDNIKPASLYTGSGELNQADTVVGFGKTGTGNSGDIEVRRPEARCAERHQPDREQASLGGRF